MDKLQRFEFQQSIEGYLEQNQVYELFEGLLKELVLHRPDQPLDYIIQKLQKPKGTVLEFFIYYRYSSSRIFDWTRRCPKKGECTRFS